MSDLSVTAASVVQGTGAGIDRTANAGETITAGQAVYKAATGKWMKADNNAGTAIARTPQGIALNGAALDQPLAVQKSGPITIGATLTAGVAYYLSGTAGGICPVGDLTTGMYPTILGIATSTTVLDVDIQLSNVAL